MLYADHFAQAEYKTALIYETLFWVETNSDFRKLLKKLAASEREDFAFWQKLVTPDRQLYGISPFERWFYKTFRRLFGLTMTAKLLERREQQMIANYHSFRQTITDAKLRHQIDEFIRRELLDEACLKDVIKENHLNSMANIMLGFNDGLIELTGTLTGLTLALQGTKLVAVTGLIAGLSATLSMTASAYAQARYDPLKNPKTAALSTGITYLIIVLLLIFPFLIAHDPATALAAMLVIVLIILLAAAGYTAILYDKPFFRQFLEMAIISLGVAAISFGLGFVLRQLFGLNAN